MNRLRDAMLWIRTINFYRTAFWVGRIFWHAVILLPMWLMYYLGTLQGMTHKPAPVVHFYTNCPAIPADAEPLKEE